MTKHKHLFLLAALGLLSGTADAAAICVGCERIDGAPATYVGPHNPAATDVSTFQHTNIQSDVGASKPFTDYWVYDVTMADDGSVSADFTVATRVLNFQAAVFADGGSDCPGGPGSACNTLVLGAQLKGPGDDVDPGLARFEFLFGGVPAGRYVLRVTGQTPANGASAYGGQASFVPTPEPGLLGLLGLGLVGFAAARRRRD